MSEKTPFDYVKSINTKSEYLGDDLSDYSSYIVSKALASYPDCIFLVNEVKLYPPLSDKMEYDYYYHTIQKSKRFSKWYKKDYETYTDIMKYFDVSYKKAQEMLSLLSEEDLKKIHTYLNVGITD